MPVLFPITKTLGKAALSVVSILHLPSLTVQHALVNTSSRSTMVHEPWGQSSLVARRDNLTHRSTQNGLSPVATAVSLMSCVPFVAFPVVCNAILPEPVEDRPQGLMPAGTPGAQAGWAVEGAELRVSQ